MRTSLLLVALSIVLLVGIASAATTFNGLPNGIVPPGTALTASYNAASDWNDNDWFGLFVSNQTCCPGDCGCYLQWAWLTAASGSVQFSADATKGVAAADLIILHVRENSTSGVASILGSSSVVKIRASATITPKTPIIAGQSVFVSYTTDAQHSTLDWIGIYEAGAVDYSSFVYVTEGATGTAIIPLDANLAGKQIEFRYIFWYADQIVTTTQTYTVAAALPGKCASDCANANVNCNPTGDGSECGTCGSGSDICIPPLTPTFIGTTPEDSSNFLINVNESWNTTVLTNTTGITCTNWKFYYDGPLKMTASGSNANQTRLSWTPLESDANADYEVCFALRCEDNGIATERRCFRPFVRSSSCSAWGDPHFTTFDDYTYDYMGIGDYVLMKNVKDSSLAVHIRYAPCFQEDTDGPTCATAFAFRYVTDEVVMYWQNCALELYINGQQQNSQTNLTFGGGYFTRLLDWDGIADHGYEISVGDFLATVTLTSGGDNYCFGNVNLRPTKFSFGGIAGMCGTWDGDASNDLQFPNGSVTASPSAFGNSWRVLESDSLFNYTRVGANYTQVNNFTKTSSSSTIDWQSSEFEDAAKQLCAGIPDLTAAEVQACLYDVAVSGNLNYARFTAAKSVSQCTADTNAATADCNPNAKCASLKYCNFHGNCTTAGACQCSKGFTGSMCETAVQFSSANSLVFSASIFLLVLIMIVAF